MAGLIVFDPRNEAIGLTTSDELAVGSYLDIETDILYFTDGSAIYAWEGDGNNQQEYTWKSGKVRLPKKLNLGAAIVEAETYTDVVFKLWADIEGTMVLKLTHTVTSAEPFRLPGGYQSNIYEVQLVGTDIVSRFSVAENIWELAEG